MRNLITIQHRLLPEAVLLALLLTFSACNTADKANGTMPATTPVATETPAPTNTAVPTLEPTAMPTQEPPAASSPTATETPVPVLTTTPEPTATPSITATPTPMATVLPTPTPTPMITVLPTPTPVPELIPVSTVAPSPTGTPAPTATPRPTATAVPTELPVREGFPELTRKDDVILNERCFSTEEEANRYFFEMALKGYYQFGILAEDLSMLHTAEEYMQLYPPVLDLEMESLTKYKNGYYLRFSDVKLISVDAEQAYAIQTSDTSFLDATELAAHEKLLHIAKELKLNEKNELETIMAVHDYLILNTKYDQAAASLGEISDSQTMEGTLLNGLAVCSGYASTFRLFMLLQDIPCEYVQNNTHAWNLVNVGNEWYHIDVTWDDPLPDEEGRLLYTHFMMTDEEISKLDDHRTWDCECGEVHICDDNSYRIYPYRDYIVSTEEEAASLILSQAENNIVTLVYPSDRTLTQEGLLQLTSQVLGLSSLSYYPSEVLGDSHILLRIITQVP